MRAIDDTLPVTAGAYAEQVRDLARFLEDSLAGLAKQRQELEATLHETLMAEGYGRNRAEQEAVNVTRASSVLGEYLNDTATRAHDHLDSLGNLRAGLVIRGRS